MVVPVEGHAFDKLVASADHAIEPPQHIMAIDIDWVDGVSVDGRLRRLAKLWSPREQQLVDRHVHAGAGQAIDVTWERAEPRPPVQALDLCSGHAGGASRSGFRHGAVVGSLGARMTSGQDMPRAS